jgi:predicted ATPase/class 3 adenylate cyclase/DNA-binding winged helix-turn-helix (wHTH) protein
MDDSSNTDLPLRTRLLAVLVADAVGYSRLMSIDDLGTVAALDAARTVFSAEIAGHDGRVIDMAGDSVLAVFETATAAVKAALAIQRQLAASTGDDVPDDRRMRFRLGIHVGDVIEKSDGTVYGDGVNIAARLEGLADPGGVAVSHAVQGIVAGRVEIGFVDIGEQTVKNIAQPVRAFRLSASANAVSIAPNTARFNAAPQNLRFGSIDIRPAQRQLWVEGREVLIGGRAFDVLLHLVEHRHQVVPKNQLLEHVWQRMEVNDSNLQTQISALRKLLGNTAIATFPGRGYRFTLEDSDEPSGAFKPVTTAESNAPISPTAPAPVGKALPPAPTGMLGRDDDLAALERLLQQHRLVTVVGAGGIGKTTLALAGAHGAQADATDGTAWVELAPLADPALLVSVVARELGIPVPGSNPQAALVKTLAERHMLLVLDNAEHLLEAVAALVQALLEGAPGVRVLVTSQAALNIGGERLFRLGALAAPDPGASVEEALSYGAVALFVDRAQAADRHFELTPENLPAVVDLCVHLDGVALAIKLAAARLPLFGLKGLQAKLSERFRLLGQGPRSAPSRQQTLRAALDWSHALLSPAERTVFRRLGVFLSGFELDLAAKTACDEALDEWAVIEALGALVDRSLVMLDTKFDGRYRLLESAREYALAKLDESGERGSTNERAARVLRQHFPALAEAEPQTMARHLTDGGCLAEAVTDWERAANQALARSAHVEAALHLHKAIELTRVLATKASDPTDVQRRELALRLRLGPLVMMTKGLGSEAAERLYGEALTLCHGVGTASDSFIATFNLWFIAEAQLRFDQAELHIAESAKLAREIGDERFILQAHHGAYTTSAITGNWAQVLVDTEETYRRYRPIDGPFHQSTFAGHDPGVCSQGVRATALLVLGQPEQAYSQLDALQPLIRDHTHPPSRIVGWLCVCLTYITAREPLRMRATAQEALAIIRRMSLQQYDGMFTVYTAWAAALIDRDPAVVPLLAAGVERFEATGTRLRASLLRAIAADACAVLGEVEPGLAFVERGLRELLERKELGWHAYTLIVRGSLLSLAGKREEAEASFEEALAVARVQGARGYELRAANGLARLWHEDGLIENVRPLIEPLLEQFTPGFSTPDLDEARALLCAAQQ